MGGPNKILPFPRKGQRKYNHLRVVAKNSKSIATRFTKEGVNLHATVSFDANIWEDICRKFEEEHKITRQELYAVIAHTYPSWGGRLENEGGQAPEYWVNSELILDARMGWAKFKREIDRAIRLFHPKAAEFELFWHHRKTTSENELGFFNYENTKVDNEFYGIYEEEEDEPA